MRLRPVVLLLAAGLVALPACVRTAPPTPPVAVVESKAGAVGAERISAAPRRAPEKPRLVVLVVFDQMRGDYLERWRTLFTGGGFDRMLREGVWFTNCHYPYAVTATGPGHASILAGCSPDKHGIVGNEFFDRVIGARVYCATTPLDERRPPVSAAKGKKIPEGGSPRRLLAPTFADALKQTWPAAKVIGLSLKDRSAILPVGSRDEKTRADGAYWLDSTDGRFVTSSFFRDGLPSWLRAFNDNRQLFDQWFGTQWTRLEPALPYEKYSGPDDQEGEGVGVAEKAAPDKKDAFRQGATFPHPMGPSSGQPGVLYYESVVNSPFGNTLLLELTRAALAGEKLGQDDVPDLLTVGFSSNDYVGHAWGPDSQEVLDITLRSDRLMADFLRMLDEQVGVGRYVVVLTADHGICPLPEVSRQKGLDAKRVPFKEMVDGAKAHLRATLGTDAKSDNSDWIIEPDGVIPPWFYLNYRLIEARGLSVDHVARVLADFLAKQPDVERAFTAAELRGTFPPHDPVALRMQRNYRPDRCGDVGIVLKPYYLLGEDRYSKAGANHGTPHPYDTHVPLVVFGGNVRSGIRKDAVTPQAAAAIFAQALGIKPPAAAEYPAPIGLFSQ